MSAFLMYIVCKCHLEAMERDLSDKDLGWYKNTPYYGKKYFWCAALWNDQMITTRPDR